MTEQIDWNTELRAIERAFDGLPPEPSPTELRARRSAEFRARLEEEERAVFLGGVGRLVLAGLFVALACWPYWWTCGFGLAPLLAAQSAAVIGAARAAAYSWEHRFARMHTMALVLFAVALMLFSAQLLPRLGYGAGSDAARWSCAEQVPHEERALSTD